MSLKSDVGGGWPVRDLMVNCRFIPRKSVREPGRAGRTHTAD